MKPILYFVFLFFAFLVKAQPPTKFYTKVGSNGYEYAYDVKQTLDGGYILCGSTSSFGQGNTDSYLVKLDSMGQIKFEKTFGGPQNDCAKSVIQLTDSSYIISGYSNSFGVGGYNIYLAQIDKNGNLNWQKNLGGDDWDFANSMFQTNDGGLIICGTTYSYGRGKADGYVLKTDLSGNIIWQKTYGGKHDDEFKSVVQTQDGNYALTGYTKSYNDTVNGDAWIFKLDVNGDSLYCSTFGGTYKDVLNKVTQFPNGNLYFAGSNESHTNGANSVNWLYLIDNTNNVIVNDFIGNTNQEWYNSSCVGLNGTVATVGFNKYVGTNADANIHIYTQNLSYVAFYPFGIDSFDELFAINPTKDKGFVAVGTSLGNSTLLNDVLFVKTDSLGQYGAGIISVKEQTKNGISVNLYPNPVSDYLNVKVLNGKQFKSLSYKLLNTSGVVVDENNIYNNDFIKVITNNLTNGLYFIQINDGDKLLYTSKISVAR